MTAPDDLTPQQRALYDDLRDHMLANAEADGVHDDPRVQLHRRRAAAGLDPRYSAA